MTLPHDTGRPDATRIARRLDRSSTSGPDDARNDVPTEPNHTPLQDAAPRQPTASLPEVNPSSENIAWRPTGPYGEMECTISSASSDFTGWHYAISSETRATAELGRGTSAAMLTGPANRETARSTSLIYVLESNQPLRPRRTSMPLVVVDRINRRYGNWVWAIPVTFAVVLLATQFFGQSSDTPEPVSATNDHVLITPDAAVGTASASPRSLELEGTNSRPAGSPDNDASSLSNQLSGNALLGPSTPGIVASDVPNAGTFRTAIDVVAVPILASRDGVVQTIHVAAGRTARADAPLITVSPRNSQDGTGPNFIAAPHQSARPGSDRTTSVTPADVQQLADRHRRASRRWEQGLLLAAKGHITPDELEQLAGESRRTEAALVAARNSVTQNEQAQSEAFTVPTSAANEAASQITDAQQVRSPVTGVVAHWNVSAGQQVRAGDVLGTAHDLLNKKLRIDAHDNAQVRKWVHALQRGDTTTIWLARDHEQTPCEVQVVDVVAGGSPYPASVSGRTAELEVVVADPTGSFVAGESVQIFLSDATVR